MEKLKTLIPTNANSWPNVVNELNKVRDNFNTIEQNEDQEDQKFEHIEQEIVDTNTKIDNEVQELTYPTSHLEGKVIVNCVDDSADIDDEFFSAIVIDSSNDILGCIKSNNDTTSFGGYNEEFNAFVDGDGCVINKVVRSDELSEASYDSDPVDAYVKYNNKYYSIDSEGNLTEINVETNNKLTKIKYEDLVYKMNNNLLIPGMWYKIIDYMTTVNDVWMVVDETHFDVIVQAISPNKISSDARAIEKEDSTYFSSKRIDCSKWKLRYDVNNDKNFDYKFLKIGNDFYYFNEYDDSQTIYDFVNDGSININLQSLKDIILAKNRDSSDDFCIASSNSIILVENNIVTEILDSTLEEYIAVGDDIRDYIAYQYRGTITYMEDELNNKASYDFKTIQFCRFKAADNDILYAKDFDEDGDYKYQTEQAAKNIRILMGDGSSLSTDASAPTSNNLSYWFCNPPYDTEDIIKKGDNLNYSDYYRAKNGDDGEIGSDNFYKTMSYVCDNDDGVIVQINTTPYYFYTFSKVVSSESGLITDASLSNNCNNNEIKPRDSYNTPNNIVFMSYNTDLNCYSNNIGYSNYGNTFGNEICYNTFGNGIRYNTFGNDIHDNTFGNYVYNNTFGNGIRYNTFGNYIYENTFGNSIYDNTFGNYIYENTFGNNIEYNTFGNEIYYNTFGNYIERNTFGNYIEYNTFGNNIEYNTFGNYIEYFIFPSVRYSFIFSGLEGNDSLGRTDLSDYIEDSSFFGQKSNDDWVSKSYRSFLD